MNGALRLRYVAALTTWPALMPPSLVAPKRTEPEGRTWTGSAHRISRASNSDATKLSNTAPGRLHSASPVTSSNGEFEARRFVMVVNPRHHRYAGQRTSCLGHMRLTSVFAFGRMVGGAVYCGLFPGLVRIPKSDSAESGVDSDAPVRTPTNGFLLPCS